MTAQELQFELMKIASFNEFDGNQVVKNLQAHPELWKGAVMDGTNVKLRDISDNYWNVDTLLITSKPGKEDELEALAKTWGADEVDWMSATESAQELGSWNPETRTNQKQILRIWWD